MDVSVIIVNYNARSYLRNCLESLFKAISRGSLKCEVFVVDNNSGDGSKEMVKGEFPLVNLIENRGNVGFSKANNQAIQVSKGRYILLLNPDTVVMPKSLDLMVEFMEKNQGIGILGPKMLIDSNGSIQPSVSEFPTPFTIFLRFCVPRAFLSHVVKNFIRKSKIERLLGSQVRTYFSPLRLEFPVEVDSISGACILARREVIEQVGLLDENIFMYLEDVDLCLRVKKRGGRIVYFPKAEIIHYCGQSSGGDFNPVSFCRRSQSVCYYFEKHHGRADCIKVKILLTVALISRGPWFLYYSHIFKKRDKNVDLWKKYKATLMKIIVGKTHE